MVEIEHDAELPAVVVQQVRRREPHRRAAAVDARGVPVGTGQDVPVVEALPGDVGQRRRAETGGGEHLLAAGQGGDERGA
ncbi:hypothetical protein ABZ570_19250 [Micromonospora sp. NPDC007271]|uniref:hypothetical protein n=1 Tax=Micromonospora sp. NPDC007271 TaxID=3154587 RepID=UPI0033D543DF